MDWPTNQYPDYPDNGHSDRLACRRIDRSINQPTATPTNQPTETTERPIHYPRHLQHSQVTTPIYPPTQPTPPRQLLRENYRPHSNKKKHRQRANPGRRQPFLPALPREAPAPLSHVRCAASRFRAGGGADRHPSPCRQ